MHSLLWSPREDCEEYCAGMFSGGGHVARGLWPLAAGIGRSCQGTASGAPGSFGPFSRSFSSKVDYAAVTLQPDGAGQLIAVASRTLRKGELVERGVLRPIGPGAQPSCFVLERHLDFKPPPDAPVPMTCNGFISSGLGMYYGRGEQGFNAQIELAPEAQTTAFEFLLHATEDIPAGAPIIRRALKAVRPEHVANPARKYAQLCRLSQSDITKYIEFRRTLDAEAAAGPGQVEELHEASLREHIELLESGKRPLTGDSNTVAVRPHPSWPGYGVFAVKAFKKGEAVEWGIQVQIDGVDGHQCPYVFTWNRDGKRKPTGNVWTAGSGASMLYNSTVDSNVRLYRLFDWHSFLIVAKRDIAEGEELTFDYQFDCLGSETRDRCYCGAKNCGGVFGGKIPENNGRQAPRSRERATKRARVTVDSLCFLCGQSGEDLAPCGVKDCGKLYHPACMHVRGSHRLLCPSHDCCVCHRNSTIFCKLCPVAYCSPMHAVAGSAASPDSFVCCAHTSDKRTEEDQPRIMELLAHRLYVRAAPVSEASDSPSTAMAVDTASMAHEYTLAAEGTEL